MPLSTPSRYQGTRALNDGKPRIGPNGGLWVGLAADAPVVDGIEARVTGRFG